MYQPCRYPTVAYLSHRQDINTSPHLSSPRFTSLHFSSSEIASLVTLSHINDRIQYPDSKNNQMYSQSDADNHREESTYV